MLADGEDAGDSAGEPMTSVRTFPNAKSRSNVTNFDCFDNVLEILRLLCVFERVSTHLLLGEDGIILSLADVSDDNVSLDSPWTSRGPRELFRSSVDSIVFDCLDRVVVWISKGVRMRLC